MIKLHSSPAENQVMERLTAAKLMIFLY